jgi:hypothetical protein
MFVSMNTLFTFMAHMSQYDGYGYAATKIADALRATTFGVPEVRTVNMAGENHNGRSSDLPETYSIRGTAVVMCVPLGWQKVQADQLVGYTMFEATRPPRGWVQMINQQAEALLVPSLWSEVVFREAGVTVPIEKIPLGVDTNDYPVLSRVRDGEPYTFLWSGTPDLRKGWDIAYKAFRDAFGNRQDVRLLLHFRQAPDGVRFRDDNVDVVAGKLPLSQMHDLLQQADCFVYPSRGEGWGLPPREAAATGLPVIATDCSGLADHLEDWGIPLSVKGQQAAYYGTWHAGEIGEWAVPNTNHLIELMKTAVSHKELMESKGQSASRWLTDHTPWSRTARGMMAAVSLHQETSC